MAHYFQYRNNNKGQGNRKREQARMTKETFDLLYPLMDMNCILTKLVTCTHYNYSAN